MWEHFSLERNVVDRRDWSDRPFQRGAVSTVGKKDKIRSFLNPKFKTKINMTILTYKQVGTFLAYVEQARRSLRAHHLSQTEVTEPADHWKCGTSGTVDRHEHMAGPLGYSFLQWRS